MALQRKKRLEKTERKKRLEKTERKKNVCEESPKVFSFIMAYKNTDIDLTVTRL